jgi:hypothetical protein
MSFRARVLIFALLLVIVPLGLQAAEDAVSAPDCVPVAAASSSEAALQTLVSGTFTKTLLDGPEPIAQCTYTCGPLGLCPDIRDLPPGQCINGCCEYETSCSSTCSFDIDCGPMASCWSGCCYSWNH